MCESGSPPPGRFLIKLASRDEPVQIVADTICSQPNIGKHFLKRNRAGKAVGGGGEYRTTSVRAD